MAKTGPMEMDDSLRCAARYHSQYLVEKEREGQLPRDEHKSPGGALGETYGARAKNAGYERQTAGENITNASVDPKGAVQAWLRSTDGHCEALFQPHAKFVGIGQDVVGYNRRTTAVFGQ